MQRRRVLIVDGYNVIRNNPRYSELGSDFDGGEAWNKARETLINDSAAFAAHRYERCHVVFDGAGNPASAGKPQKRLGVEVIFSAAGTSADSVIEKLAHDAREQGFEVVVVSSDAVIQSTVYGGGVVRMSSLTFGSTAQELEDDWHANNPAPRTHNTLVERVDPDTAAKLERMRRGLD